MRQGQGLIKFVAIAMVIICIYQLSFTLVGMKFNKAENEYVSTQIKNSGANLDASEKRFKENEYRTLFRDSFTEKPFLDLFLVSYDFKNITKNQIKLGLDLKGGMSFVLAVNQEDVIKALSNNSKDVNFNKALAEATKMQQNSQNDYLSLFLEAYNQIDANGKLANVFLGNSKYQGKINANDNNQKVIEEIKLDVNSAIFNTYNVLQTRINQYGLSEPVITLQEGAGRIIVELPGADDLPRIKKLLETSAKLEFWQTYENAEIVQDLVKANESLKGALALSKSTNTKVADSASNDTTAASALLGNVSNKSKDSSNKNSNPLFELLQLNVNQQSGAPEQGPIIGYAQAKNMKKIEEYLAMDALKKDFKADVRFLWEAKPVEENSKVYRLYAVKASTENAPLTGESIVSSQRQSDQFGKPSIGMTMNAQGANIWQTMTRNAANEGNKSIAIVLDNRVYSAPRVQNEIAGGQSSITGQFSVEEANDLSNILNSGKIDAPAKIIQEEVVGPSLGKETIASGILALLVGLMSILAFMFFVYRTPGGMADIALIINLFFLLGVLASREAVLTLPGIAGIVLIIGAAVDANVLIFERIKEELRNGKNYLDAVAIGFKNTYAAILDANITTLITSFTLFYFGFGPIKGFAYTLIVGIFTSVFTAVLLTREMFNAKHDKKQEVSFVKSFIDKYFGNAKYAFINNRKKAYLFLGLFVIVGLASIFTRGFDMGVDFKGGRSYVVTFDKNVNTPEIKSSLDKILDNKTIVKTYGQPNQVQITTSYLYGETETAEKAKINDSIVLTKIYEGCLNNYTSKPDYEQFILNKVSNFRKIDATIADEIRNSSSIVAIIAFALIFIYISFRFSKWQFAIAAIICLIHDALFTLGILSLLKDIVPFSLEMNQTIIAAILTIIGFSTNDTVVIFDRIREFTKRNPHMPLADLFNNAVNNTLGRTFTTAFTLFITSLILFFFGGESIRGFAFTMTIGVFVGTLSSIFIAAPLTLDLIEKFSKKK